MYISRMPINGARRSAMEIIASPNKMHAAVEASYPPVADSDACENAPTATESGRILWRIDPIAGEGRSAWLYVVSPRRPDFTHLCEQVGWPVEGGLGDKRLRASPEPAIGRTTLAVSPESQSGSQGS